MLLPLVVVASLVGVYYPKSPEIHATTTSINSLKLNGMESVSVVRMRVGWVGLGAVGGWAGYGGMRSFVCVGGEDGHPCMLLCVVTRTTRGCPCSATTHHPSTP